MGRATPSWVVMADTGARCLRCGKVEKMPTPMPLEAFTPWTEYVGAMHAGCRDVGRADPVPQSVEEWATGHDTGISSKSIYRHMRGLPPDPLWGVGYPCDPSDFGRCYRLLALAPEWRARIGEMAQYGPGWAALAGAWDELTTMYEAVLASNARTAPALYERMQELSARAVEGVGNG